MIQIKSTNQAKESRDQPAWSYQPGCQITGERRSEKWDIQK